MVRSKGKVEYAVNKEDEGEKVSARSCTTKLRALATRENAWSCFLFTLCFFPVLMALYILFFGHIHAQLNYSQKYPDNQVYDDSGRRIYRTVYFGDSLIYNSDRDYAFITKELNTLGQLWPSAAFDAVDAGIGGNTVSKLLARIDKDVLAHNPDCVIVYFDSDASDINSARDASVKEDYEANMRLMLGILTKRTPCVGLGGPTIYGEFPRGSGLNPRDDIYEDYVAINERVAAQYNVTYWHTRDAFFAAIPSGWMANEGWLTQDGEHHNADGVAIISKFFIEFLVTKYTQIIGISPKFT